MRAKLQDQATEPGQASSVLFLPTRSRSAQRWYTTRQQGPHAPLFQDPPSGDTRGHCNIICEMILVPPEAAMTSQHRRVGLSSNSSCLSSPEGLAFHRQGR